jgi:hypothetical protein
MKRWRELRVRIGCADPSARLSQARRGLMSRRQNG